jgi:transposase
LPEDPALLQHMLREAQAEITRLQMLIAVLLRNRFGRRSERLGEDALQQGIEDIEQSLSEQAAKLEAAQPVAERPAQPPKRNRGSLPEHLPRVEVLVDIADKTCACCGAPLHAIGEDRSEMLDYVPAQIRVQVIRRPRYGCRRCEGAVVQAPAPERPIDGGLATEALLAHVLVNKYADHLPLYRQSQIFARQGVELDRSTLCNWVGRACWWLEPLSELVLSTVLSSPKVVADDTTLPVLDPGRGRTKTGRLWCYAVDNRPWSGPGHPAAAYAYSEDRKGEHPATHLKGFRGLLQVDGYTGFGGLVTGAANDAPTLAFCWAHTIRTQSNVCGRLQFVPRHMTTQRDDMLDLQGVVVDDDALDDQPQDGLTLAEISGSQPATDTLAERGQASECFVCLEPLLVKAALPVILLLRQLAPLEECSSLAG